VKNYKEFIKNKHALHGKSVSIHMWRLNNTAYYEYMEKWIDIIDGDDAVQRLQVSR
jgi:hypothetical protein